MTIKGKKVRLLGVTAGLVLTMLAGCMTPAHQVRSALPTPCTDSTYVELKAQHPDSLSDREWQRLQRLDGECADARASESRRQSARHGGGMRMGRGAGIGIMTAVMAAMMVATR